MKKEKYADKGCHSERLLYGTRSSWRGKQNNCICVGRICFFDEEAFVEEKEAEQDKKKKRKNLSKYITGMDDLLERGIYHKFGEGKNPLKVEKDHVEANRAEFLRSRNQPLKRSINGLDKKLAEVSGYKPFIKNKEVNVKGESVLREFLNISDLDVMAIFRRSSSRWNVVEKIEKARAIILVLTSKGFKN